MGRGSTIQTLLQPNIASYSHDMSTTTIGRRWLALVNSVYACHLFDLFPLSIGCLVREKLLPIKGLCLFTTKYQITKWAHIIQMMSVFLVWNSCFCRLLMRVCDFIFQIF